MNIYFFDYIYYTIAFQYNKWGYEIQKEFAGITILSLIQFFNIFAILGFLKISLFKINFINPFFIALLAVFLLSIINAIRYKAFITYKELAKKWDDDNKKSNVIKKTFVVFYIIMTFVLSIISASMVK